MLSLGHTRSLITGLNGLATCAHVWDSRRFAAGDHCGRVTLRDAAGDLLDRAKRPIRLGAFAAEVTALSAAPFSLGQPVSLAADVKNTGTVELTGRALIKVRNPSGQIAQPL